MRRVRSALAVLAVVAFAAGCGATVGGSAVRGELAPPAAAMSAQAPIPTSAMEPPSKVTVTQTAPTTVTRMTRPPKPTLRPGPPIGDTALLTAIHVAIAGTAAAWRDFFPQWTLPTVWHGDGLYDSVGREAWTDDWRQGPTCIGESALPDNALYCGANDTVAWDLALLTEMDRGLGPWVSHLIVAHEVGHAVQARLAASGQGHLVWPQRELQADCLAGALIYQSAGDGFLGTLQGDPDELLAAQVAVSDAEPWAKPGDHGDAAERASAFQTGVGDIEACLTPTFRKPVDDDPTDIPGFDANARFTLASPSGNILCAYIDSVLKCTILEYDFASRCTGLGLPMITLDTESTAEARSCGGRALLALGTMDPTVYGDVVELGPFTCGIETSGVTCGNDTGGGFLLSRARLELR